MTDWFLFLLPFFHHFSLISSRVTLLVERYISELFPIIETKHILKLKWIDIGFYIHTKEKWFYWNYICQTEAKWIGEKKHIQLETVRRATGRGSCTFRKLIFSEEISLLCVLCKIDANFFIISTYSIFHFTKTFLINHEIYRITCLIVAERTYFNLCSDKCQQNHKTSEISLLFDADSSQGLLSSVQLCPPQLFWGQQNTTFPYTTTFLVHAGPLFEVDRAATVSC